LDLWKKNEKRYKDDFTTVKQYMDSEDKAEIPDDWEKADKPGNVFVKKISGQDTCNLVECSFWQMDFQLIMLLSR